MKLHTTIDDTRDLRVQTYKDYIRRDEAECWDAMIESLDYCKFLAMLNDVLMGDGKYVVEDLRAFYRYVISRKAERLADSDGGLPYV